MKHDKKCEACARWRASRKPKNTRELTPEQRKWLWEDWIMINTYI